MSFPKRPGPLDAGASDVLGWGAVDFFFFGLGWLLGQGAGVGPFWSLWVAMAVGFGWMWATLPPYEMGNSSEE